MSMDAALLTFYAEAEELLEAMESALLVFEDDKGTQELLNDIYRSVHTIKGSAGIFGLDHIVDFTHVVENVLDLAREKRVENEQETIEPGLISLLLSCRDHINQLVHIDLQEYESNKPLKEQSADLIQRLSFWLSTEEDVNSEVSAFGKSEIDVSIGNSEESSAGSNWHISLRLSQDCLQNGMDPLSFIRYLATLGTITQIETLVDELPAFENFDPESLYLKYEISLDSQADEETIKNTFMFVEEDSSINILPPTSSVEDYIELIKSLPEEDALLSDIFVKSGVISQDVAIAALSTEEHAESFEMQEDNQQEWSNEGVKNQFIENTPQHVISELTQGGNALVKKQIRIDANKLDQLISLIGELVISRQRVDTLIDQQGNSDLKESVENIGSFTEQIRDAALSLRMVPIGATLKKFKRIVRDSAQALGKEIDLQIEGAGTELDRLMVEKLTDPLTHIVRNALDHGIEEKQVRIDKGKPPSGKLLLRASHSAGHIVVEVRDDGRGIDKEKIMAKAISQGIINSNIELTESEILHLIFHPGFSTADSVTNLSGRGVGMDVVKRNVEALQGNIDIVSEQDKGATFKIRLPLTLAIIDGFHVSSQGTHFIIPQATVVECIDLDSHLDVENRECINLRGEMIPFLELSEIFCLERGSLASRANSRRKKLTIVRFGEDRAGVVVDELFGAIQTVVKPLGPLFQPLKGIGGSTLLGTGEIAFILDIAQLIDVAISRDVKWSSRQLNRQENQ